MADKTKKYQEKPIRVQFGKDATAEDISDAMDVMFDAWAKSHPEIAHEKYPTVYDEQGNWIKPT